MSQTAEWRQAAAAAVASVEAGIEDQLRAIHVPDEALPAELAAMQGYLDPVCARLGQPELTYGDARGLPGAVDGSRHRIELRIAELRERYDAGPKPVRVTWSALVGGAVELRSTEDVDGLLADVRTKLTSRLDGGTVIVE